VIRALFACVTVGLIIAAVAAHMLGAQDVADWSGTGAYFAIVLALLAATIEAAVRKKKDKALASLKGSASEPADYRE
jgi:hypothetical protein